MRGAATPPSRQRSRPSHVAAACAAASMTASAGALPPVTRGHMAGMRAVQIRPSGISPVIPVTKRIGGCCGSSVSGAGASAGGRTIVVCAAEAAPRCSGPSSNAAFATRVSPRVMSTRTRPFVARAASSSRSPGTTRCRSRANGIVCTGASRAETRMAVSTIIASSTTPGRIGRPGKWPAKYGASAARVMLAFTRASP